MSLLWLVVLYLSAFEIEGFDIGRKLWKDKAKSDEAETELTNLGSNMDGRSMPLLSDELSDLDDSVELVLTKDTPDFAERGLPLFDDELQGQDAAIEPYLTKETPEFSDRGLSPLDDEQQDAIEAYVNRDMSDHVDRGLPPFDDEQLDLEELNAAVPDLTGDDLDVDKRNSLTIFDMFNDISDRLDDIQKQVNELKEGKKIDNCPDGWYTYGKSCYHFSNAEANWFEALTYCQNFHGYLAEINSYSENAYLWRKVKSVKGTYWVGGTDSIKENHWMWAHSHSPLTTSEFKDWRSGEPSNTGGDEHCMELRYGYLGWNDNYCGKSQRFICERDLK